MQGCDDIRNMCVFSGKMLLFILCLTMIDPPNHHGHLRAANHVVFPVTCKNEMEAKWGDSKNEIGPQWSSYASFL